MAQGDLLNRTRDVLVHIADKVADGKRLERQNHDAAGDIAHRVLRGKAEDDCDDAAGCEQHVHGGFRTGNAVNDDQRGKEIDQHAHDIFGEHEQGAASGSGRAHALNQAVKRLVDHLDHVMRHQQNQQDKHQPSDPGRQMQHPRDALDALDRVFRRLRRVLLPRDDLGHAGGADCLCQRPQCHSDIHRSPPE